METVESVVLLLLLLLPGHVRPGVRHTQGWVLGPRTAGAASWEWSVCSAGKAQRLLAGGPHDRLLCGD